MNCGGWTKGGGGMAMPGHHDRTGLDTDSWALSWNSSRTSRACAQDALKSSGGAGLFYQLLRIASGPKVLMATAYQEDIQEKNRHAAQ